MEEDTKERSITEGYTTDRTIWALPYSRTRGPGVVIRTFSVYRIKMAIKEYKDPDAVTAKEKKTLFYKLFGMSKRQWDNHIKRHNSQLNKKQRDYFLSVRPEKEKK